MAEVTFEIDRFDWAGDGRLELAGRWFGLRGHRFLRPTLDVDVDGERRRMLADLEHKPWAADDGAEWVAAFTWRGDPAPFDDAELTVSPDLAVQLPAVGGAARANSGRAAGTVERRPAGPSRTTVLEGELASAISETQRLREQLSAEQTNVRGIDSQLRQARAELAAAQAEAEAARAEAEAVRAAETEARDEGSLARAEADRARADAEAAREEARMAVPEADGLRAELVSAQRELEAALARVNATERELAAATEARDRARDERNAWMQRARAVAAGRPSAARAPTPESEPEAEPEQPTAAMPPPEPAPEAEPVAKPAVERRTIQIGERPKPVRPEPATEVHPPIRRGPLDGRAPRLLAVVALLVLVAMVLALIFLAL
jgi:multidrug efflux pump subunit AcrA (membrane-fusion protein)